MPTINRVCPWTSLNVNRSPLCYTGILLDFSIAYSASLLSIQAPHPKIRLTKALNRDTLNQASSGENHWTFDSDRPNFDGRILWKVKLCVYNCSLLELTYRRLTKKLTPVIKSLNSHSAQLLLEKRRNFEGGPLCSKQFFSTNYKTGEIVIFVWHARWEFYGNFYHT